jgi:hypothetical protein
MPWLSSKDDWQASRRLIALSDPIGVAMAMAMISSSLWKKDQWTKLSL